MLIKGWSWLTIPALMSCFARITLALLVAMVSVACPLRNSELSRSLQGTPLTRTRAATGLYHHVKSGETLYGIARVYNVNRQELAEVNNLTPPFLIKVGGKLFIPGATRIKSVQAARFQTSEEPEVEDLAGLLAWPVKGKILSNFGVRGKTHYNGIRIKALEGAGVRCADDGIVGHVGRLAGLGNVILIEHANRLLTVYALLKETKVKRGWNVKGGEIIATVGRSGRAGPSCLYFEVRSRSKPRNPLFFLKRK